MLNIELHLERQRLKVLFLLKTNCHILAPLSFAVYLQPQLSIVCIVWVLS